MLIQFTPTSNLNCKVSHHQYSSKEVAEKRKERKQVLFKYSSVKLSTKFSWGFLNHCTNMHFFVLSKVIGLNYQGKIVWLLHN